MNKMTGINIHNIHHIIEKQYQKSVQFLVNGSVPQSLTNSAKSRLKRRRKNAQLHNKNGKYRIFVQGK
jgi:hypothetical protein